MSDSSRPSGKKRVLFFSCLALMLVGTLAMSSYKISVANAYLTLSLPEPASPAPPTEEGGPAQLARGAHVAAIVGCAECHGQDLGGQALIHVDGYAQISAPNLTAGPGGRGQTLDRHSFRRALRAGLDGERRALWLMPRTALLALAETDVDALVAYVRAKPPVAQSWPQNRLQLRGYMDVALRRLNLIDRRLVPVVPHAVTNTVGIGQVAVPLGAKPQELALWRASPPQEADAELGSYLRALGGCADCHGNTSPRPTAVSTQALRLPASNGTWERCRAATRLRAMTAIERQAALAN